MKIGCFTVIERNSMVAGSISARDLSEVIRTGNYRDGELKRSIQFLRTTLDKDEEKKKVKLSLPAITPTGEFKERRREENLINYSGVIQLDFDKIEPKDIELIREKCQKCQYAMLGALSPSGNGYKVLITTDAVKEQHELAFEQVIEWAKDYFGFEPDEKVKSIAQQMYLTWDSDCYFNPDPHLFGVEEEKQEGNESEPGTTLVSPSIARLLYKTQKKFAFEEGERNSFIHRLACLTREQGIDEEEVVSSIATLYTIADDTEEVERTIRGAYARSSAKTGSFEFELSPLIPNSVYDFLPPQFRQLCDVYSGRQKDIFFLSSLTAIGAVCPFAFMYYSTPPRKIYPTLCTYIMGNMGSGKGVASHARHLVNDVHNYLKDDYDTFDKGGDRGLFIYGDTSTAGLKQALSNNEGKGLMFETEADTITTAWNNDWGSWSDLLRRIAEHEYIGSKRIDSDPIEIPEPKMGLLVTSTPNQLKGFDNGLENGLFSRFLIYHYNESVQWKSQRPQHIESHRSAHSEYTEVITDFFKMHCSSHIEISLKEEHWRKFDTKMSDVLDDVQSNYGCNYTGMVTRMGTTLMRLVIILTIIRLMEKGTKSPHHVISSDTDFVVAMQFIDIILGHWLACFEMGGNDFNNPRASDYNMYRLMPQSFETKLYIKTASHLGVSERTAARWIANSRFYEKKQHGFYVKRVAVGNSGSLPLSQAG